MTGPDSLVGARIVVESERVARPRRAGTIEQIVHSPMPSYRVLWDDGRTSIVTPASGCARIDAVRDSDNDMPSVFQSINDSIRRLKSPALDVYDFVCECPDASCTKVMRLCGREYDDMRAVRGRFVVALGHERPSSERVVTRSEGYLVIERSRS
jgi:hypothetical protein